MVDCFNRIRGPSGRCSGLNGGPKIAEALEAGVRDCGLKVDIDQIVRLGKCAKGPNLHIGGKEFKTGLSPDDVPGLLDEFDRRAGRDDQNALLYPRAVSNSSSGCAHPIKKTPLPVV